MAMVQKTLNKPAPDEAAATEAMSDLQLREVAKDIVNPGRSIRWGIWLLLLGLGGFIVWAVTAPLDEGVPAPATVMVDTKRQTVQHLTGGVVREILVREAQRVKADEIVMRLDDTVTKANYQAARQQYFSLRAQQSRLEAERKGATQIAFHTDLGEIGHDPIANEYIDTQRQLFSSRRTALQGQQAILEQTFKATQEALRGMTAQLEGKQAQLKLTRIQLEDTRALAKDGYLPRNRWYDEERLAADMTASVGELTANIARLRNSLLEIELRIAQLKREFLRDVETQLADTTRDAQVARERLRATREELSRTEIRSPADGFVVGLMAHTVGGVIAPGARIMDVVPEDVPLTLEARVDPQFVDRIRADLPADIRIHSFIDDPRLVIEGKVLSVSADLVADQPNIPPYYLARVAITPEGMKHLGKRHLQPGMPAEIVIKTGERTLMTYLIRPLIRRVTRAFGEA